MICGSGVKQRVTIVLERMQDLNELVFLAWLIRACSAVSCALTYMLQQVAELGARLILCVRCLCGEAASKGIESPPVEATNCGKLLP